MMPLVLLNLLGFQVGWFACVLGAANGYPWIGPVIVTAIALPQAWRVDGRLGRLATLAGAAALGYVADSALVLAGLIAFPVDAALGQPSTLWMVAMWVNFAATLHGSLAWLASRYVLAAVLGLVGGPAAYLGGQSLGAIVFTAPDSWVLTSLAVEWALTTPFLVYLAHRLVGPTLASGITVATGEEARA